MHVRFVTALPPHRLSLTPDQEAIAGLTASAILQNTRAPL